MSKPSECRCCGCSYPNDEQEVWDAPWDPADDRGGPDVYVPRFNGVQAEGVEEV